MFKCLCEAFHKHKHFNYSWFRWGAAGGPSGSAAGPSRPQHSPCFGTQVAPCTFCDALHCILCITTSRKQAEQMITEWIFFLLLQHTEQKQRIRRTFQVCITQKHDKSKAGIHSNFKMHFCSSMEGKGKKTILLVHLKDPQHTTTQQYKILVPFN